MRFLLEVFTALHTLVIIGFGFRPLLCVIHNLFNIICSDPTTVNNTRTTTYRFCSPLNAFPNLLSVSLGRYSFMNGITATIRTDIFISLVPNDVNYRHANAQQQNTLDNTINENRVMFQNIGI